MAAADQSSAESQPARQSKDWNYHPDLPIAMSPVFDIPPKPKAALVWLTNTWLSLTAPVNHLVWALVVFVFLLPSMEVMKSISAGWVLQIFTINLGALVILAGSLHVYLYVLAGQKMRLKYDVRPMERKKRFTFGYQTWDNMFWSIVSGVPIWSIWTILYFYCAASGWIPTLESINASPFWFILMFFVIRFWQSFHFYWIHRLIHIPWFYKHVHHIHHRNTNVGPWSGVSMHPLEHVLYYSGILIHFVLASHPIHVLFHMFALNLGAVFTHSGFEKVVVKNKETIKAGSFHHQLHHKYFECNYGSEEIPLDRWFGSFHDGTTAATKRIRERKRKLFSAQ